MRLADGLPARLDGSDSLHRSARPSLQSDSAPLFRSLSNIALVMSASSLDLRPGPHKVEGSPISLPSH